MIMKDYGYTTISVKKETREKLYNLGKKNETWDDLLLRLTVSFEAKEAEKR